VDSSGNLHLNFKLNAKLGETLYFTSALGTLLSTIEFPSLDSDISYGLNEEGEWLYFNHPTPNEKNGMDGQETPDFKVYIDSPLMITEVMSSNSLTIFDGFGFSSDWIEFYNSGDEVINLKDAGLSTNIDDPMKWVWIALGICI